MTIFETIIISLIVGFIIGFISGYFIAPWVVNKHSPPNKFQIEVLQAIIDNNNSASMVDIHRTLTENGVLFVSVVRIDQTLEKLKSNGFVKEWVNSEYNKVFSVINIG